MEHADTQVLDAPEVLDAPRALDASQADDDAAGPELPSSLAGILEPDAALAAARRMQRWYQSTPQGAAHSLFGRDGRRVEGRLLVETVEDREA